MDGRGAQRGIKIDSLFAGESGVFWTFLAVLLLALYNHDLPHWSTPFELQ